MDAESKAIAKGLADSLTLISAGLSGLATIPFDFFTEEELNGINEAIYSMEQGREQLIGVVAAARGLDNEMKAEFLKVIEGMGQSPRRKSKKSSR